MEFDLKNLRRQSSPFPRPRRGRGTPGGGGAEGNEMEYDMISYDFKSIKELFKKSKEKRFIKKWLGFHILP